MNGSAPPVAPDAFRRYLASRGWQRRGSWRGAGVWTMPNADDLLVPERIEFDDDGEVLTEAVRRVAAYEQRSELDVALDVTEPLVDSQYFRLFPETPTGTMPLPDGANAVRGVLELMKASARTVEEGVSAHHPGKASGTVNRFLSGVKLGTSLPGSYILTTRVPIGGPAAALGIEDELPLELDTHADAGPAPVEGRRVLESMYTTLSAARSAINQLNTSAEGREVLDDAVQAGLSAQMCEALSQLGGANRDRPFEIGFAWSPDIPTEMTNNPLRFDGREAQTLHDIGKELHTLALAGTAVVEGVIEYLHNDGFSQPRVKVRGKLTVGKIEQERAIWVHLPIAIYSGHASRWHHNRTMLRVECHVERENNQIHMRVDHLDQIRELD